MKLETFPLNLDLAGGRLIDSGEHPQQRSLAGAVMAHDPDPVALRGFQG